MEAKVMVSPLIEFLIKWVMSLALLAGCLFFLELERLPEAIGSVGISAFIGAVILGFIGTILVPAILTNKALVKSKIVLPVGELVVINLAIRFYTLVLPRALAMAIRWKRYKSKAGGYNAAALMVFERLVQLLIYGLAALVFLVLDQVARDQAQISIIVLVFLVLGSSALLLFFIATGLNLQFPLSRYFSKYGWLVAAGLKIRESVKAYRDLSLGELLQIVGLSLLSYILFVEAAYFLSESMQLGLTWMQLGWVRSVVFILTLFPLTIGGIGVREVGFMMFLSLYGVDASAAFSMALALTAAQILIGVIGAVMESRRLLTRYRSK